MKRALLLPLLLLYVIAARAQVTPNGDVLGSHNLSTSGTGPVKGTGDACLYCHAPHSGVGVPNAGVIAVTCGSSV